MKTDEIYGTTDELKKEAATQQQNTSDKATNAFFHLLLHKFDYNSGTTTCFLYNFDFISDEFLDEYIFVMTDLDRDIFVPVKNKYIIIM